MSTRPHGAISHKTIIFIVTDLRTSNFKICSPLFSVCLNFFYSLFFHILQAHIL
jgi:hypothetical protein